MCITEYDELRTFEEQREEGRIEGIMEGMAEGRKRGIAEGRKEGRAEGRAEGIEIGGLSMLAGLVKKDILTLAQAAEEAHMTVAEFEAKTGLKA